MAKAKTYAKSTPKKVYKSKGNYDTSRLLVVGGAVGVFLFYALITRALNTGSYWEYFSAVAILYISIRLFIRSLRLK